jgi:diguanylate cyclase (GGDEF)-like protein
MRHSPPQAHIGAAPVIYDPAGEESLRSEIARLKRENKALSIALEEMERVAQRDMLTPLYNRRYFLSALHQRIARVDRYEDRVALVYVDVDNLKAINDGHGHAAGDFALIEVAERLSSAMRATDVLARIGGDEFGILMDNVSQSDARVKIRRLAEEIEAKPADYGGKTIPLSAAFGLTMIVAGQSAEDLMGRADAEMYRAKRAG